MGPDTPEGRLRDQLLRAQHGAVGDPGLPADPLQPDATGSTLEKDPMNVAPAQRFPDATANPRMQPPERSRGRNETLSPTQQDNLRRMAGSPQEMAKDLAKQGLTEAEAKKVLVGIYPEKAGEIANSFNDAELQAAFVRNTAQAEQTEQDSEIDLEMQANDPQVHQLESDMQERLKDNTPLSDEERSTWRRRFADAFGEKGKKVFKKVLMGGTIGIGILGILALFFYMIHGGGGRN